MTTKLLRSVPPRLKEKLAKRADRDGTSVNAVAVAALAKHYGVEFDATGRAPSGRERTNHPNIVLRMPEELRDAIEAEAAETGDFDSNVMKRILSAEFRVKYVATGRWAKVA